MQLAIVPCSAGYDSVVYARPDFYNILERQIPKEKIMFGKRILKIKEEQDKVTIECADNTRYVCDLLVGADGAYSSMRRCLYKNLTELGQLPKSDGESLVAGYTLLVGVTKPQSLDQYPDIKDEHAHFSSVMAGNGQTVIMSSFVVCFPTHALVGTKSLTHHIKTVQCDQCAG